jgi:hypothetical protein
VSPELLQRGLGSDDRGGAERHRRLLSGGDPAGGDDDRPRRLQRDRGGPIGSETYLFSTGMPSSDIPKDSVMAFNTLATDFEIGDFVIL